MSRRLILSLAVTGAALIAPVAATARTTPLATRSFTAVAREVDIEAKGVPAKGTTALAAATLSASPGGTGALITRLRFTGPTHAPATFGLTVQATAFFARGTLRLAFTGTLQLGAGGRLLFAGRGRFTGGTGVFARARGTATFTGTGPTPAPGHVDTLRISGRLSF